MPREACRDPSRGSEQEVAGTARRIDDRQRQQSLGWIGGLSLSAVENGIERRVEQRLHQAVGCVVGAASLTLVAFCLGGIGRELQGPAVISELRLQLKQGFIDRAKLLGFHGPPIDRYHSLAFDEPAQAIDRGEESAIGEPGRR
jgi:hypothetical protein